MEHIASLMGVILFRVLSKILAQLVAVFMLVGSMAALAQTVHGTEVEANTGSITIENAAKGETYTIYKLFDATIGEGDAIAYKIPEGDIPSTLKTYFEETSTGSGYLKATAAAKKENGEMSDGLKAALDAWAKTATATKNAVSDGSALTFDQLELGYYVVTTSQGQQAISVDSTQPDARSTTRTRPSRCPIRLSTANPTPLAIPSPIPPLSPPRTIWAKARMPRSLPRSRFPILCLSS